MNADQFLATIASLYRVANRADSDSPARETWTHPAMAGDACCAHLDTIVCRMLAVGVITQEQFDQFYTDL